MDRTGSSAPSPLAAGVTIVASDAPVAPDPAAPVAPGPNAEVTAFAYDLSFQLDLEFDDILMEFKVSSSPKLVRRWAQSNRVDEPIGFEDYTTNPNPSSGIIYETYAERQGSISHVVDISSGSVVAEYKYDGFGNRIQFAGTLFQHYGYAGREVDPESGLNYLRARYFDSSNGRFIQIDPVEFVGGDLNLYSYTSNDPLNRTDPTGLSETPQVVMQPGVAAGAIGFIGAGALLAAFDIYKELTLLDTAVFSKSANDENDDVNDRSGGGSGNCGPGGGPDDDLSFLKRIAHNWKEILFALLMWDTHPDPGQQASRRHVQMTEKVQEIEEELKKKKDKDDDKNC